MVKKLIYALWGMLAVGLIAIFLVFLSINKGWIGFVPPVEELENPNYKFGFFVWCGQRDLNSHASRHWILSPARLPIPPRPRCKRLVTRRRFELRTL